MLAKKRGRPATGRGQTIGVRLHEADLAALDAHIAAQPAPKPTRPEAIRRVLAERFEKPASATAPAVAEKAAKVRSKAASALDEAMSGMEAPAEEKAARRRALTEKPAMVANARAKRKG